jgi:hypothetical protein
MKPMASEVAVHPLQLEASRVPAYLVAGLDDLRVSSPLACEPMGCPEAGRAGAKNRNLGQDRCL